jgi:hypothetical protein
MVDAARSHERKPFSDSTEQEVLPETLLPQDGESAQLQGTIGVQSSAAWRDDNVRISARLYAPAYCYLLALNPDGSIQYCPRAGSGIAPGLTDEIVYPAADDEYYLWLDRRHGTAGVRPRHLPRPLAALRSMDRASGPVLSPGHTRRRLGVRWP